ncbi:hypothetical protein C8F01DRAFT_1373483 [Mycena amicta]|nr:hypothetical protein C8F01DRAFT_1373483 [Mycena amicta]
MENLPNELYDEITSYLRPHDCVGLSRTNRRLCASSARQLYRVLVLEDMERALGCFRTLAGNSSYAQRVISLNVLLDEKQTLPVALSELVEASTANLNRVQRLTIPCSTAMLHILSTTRFPCLSHCRILPCQSSVLLLHNNPSVRNLFLQALDSLDDPGPHTGLDPICLPLLDVFIGPQTFAKAILPHSRQTSLSMFYWISDDETASLESFLSTLHSMERVPKHLTTLLQRPDPGLLSRLTPHLPKIESLSLAFLYAASLDAVYELLENAHESLRTMPGLCQFNITVSDTQSLRRSGFNREFDLVRGWAAHAPNLVSCSLPTGTVWCHPLPQLWIPHPSKTPSTVMGWYGPLLMRRGLGAAYTMAFQTALGETDAIMERLRSADVPAVFGESLTRLPRDDVINDDSQASSDDDSANSSGEEDSDASAGSEDENSE